MRLRNIGLIVTFALGLPMPPLAPAPLQGPRAAQAQGGAGADSLLVAGDCASRPDGLHRQTHSNGTVSEVECRNGAANGRMTTWGPGGAKLHEVQVSQGQPVGRWTWWHPNGQPSCQFEIQNGVPSGPFVAWHPGGAAAVEGTFRDGKLEGRLTFMGAFGGFRMESDIRDGQAVQTRVWSPQGREVTLERPEFRVIMRETIRDNACAALVFMALGHGG